MTRMCCQAHASAWAVLISLLSAAPASAIRAVDLLESNEAAQASHVQEFQGYCQQVERGTYMPCGEIEDSVVEDFCLTYMAGELPPTRYLQLLKSEKCLDCSAQELATKCEAALAPQEPQAAPSIDQCVSLHEGYPKDDEKCKNWKEWLHYSGKNAHRKFEALPGTNVKGCYASPDNLGATLCKKYPLFCSVDSRTVADIEQCQGWKFKTVEVEEVAAKPVWKDPFQVARSRILNSATGDADKCLQAFHDTLTEIVTEGGKEDHIWKVFKSSGLACDSLDNFARETKWVRRHFAENAEVEDKAVCGADTNLINVVCRAYAGFCTAEEGSDLFTLPMDSWTGELVGQKCSTSTWK